MKEQEHPGAAEAPPVCLVAIPPGTVTVDGLDIDLDVVFSRYIVPAVRAAGAEPERCFGDLRGSLPGHQYLQRAALIIDPTCSDPLGAFVAGLYSALGRTPISLQPASTIGGSEKAWYYPKTPDSISENDVATLVANLSERIREAIEQDARRNDDQQADVLLLAQTSHDAPGGGTAKASNSGAPPDMDQVNALIQRGQWGQVLELLIRLPRTDRFSVDIQQLEALALARGPDTRSHAEARQLVAKLSMMQPNDGATWALGGRVHKILFEGAGAPEDLKKAIQSYRLAVKFTPSNLGYRLALVELLDAQCSPEVANQESELRDLLHGSIQPGGTNRGAVSAFRAACWVGDWDAMKSTADIWSTLSNPRPYWTLAHASILPMVQMPRHANRVDELLALLDFLSNEATLNELGGAQ